MFMKHGIMNSFTKLLSNPKPYSLDDQVSGACALSGILNRACFESGNFHCRVKI
jgi:hypothetical protein